MSDDDILYDSPPDPVPEPEPFVLYEVCGPQAIHEVRPGGTLHLDPCSAQTERLERAGHIRPAAATTAADDKGD